MVHILQKAHSGWAYLVFLLLLIAIINSFLGMLSRREFLAKDRKMALLALISTHVQLVFGLLLYFVSSRGFSSLGQMGNSELRLTALEHPLLNILAVALITIGWSRHKKKDENHAKHKSIALLYGFGFILILLRIPWSLWFK